VWKICNSRYRPQCGFSVVTRRSSRSVAWSAIHTCEVGNTVLQLMELPEMSGRFRPIISYRSSPAYHPRHDAKTVQPLPKTAFGSEGGFTCLGTVIIRD
jgi:hypothetical protein